MNKATTTPFVHTAAHMACGCAGVRLWLTSNTPHSLLQRAKAGSAAACRRDGLHTAKVATVVTSTDVSRMFLKGADGKGGVDGAEVENDRMSEVAIKPMHSWDLDDIRDWLIKACMDIAAKQVRQPQTRESRRSERAAQCDRSTPLLDPLSNTLFARAGRARAAAQGGDRAEGGAR